MTCFTYTIESRKAYPVSKKNDPAAGGYPVLVYHARAICGPDVTVPLHTSTNLHACERAVESHKMRHSAR